MAERIIQSVSIDPDGGLQINHYHPDTDVTHTGIANLSTLIVPVGGEYDDEIDAVMEALKYLIADVMQDFTNLPKLAQPQEPA
jgi:hypothetical protein